MQPIRHRLSRQAGCMVGYRVCSRGHGGFPHSAVRNCNMQLSISMIAVLDGSFEMLWCTYYAVFTTNLAHWMPINTTDFLTRSYRWWCEITRWCRRGLFTIHKGHRLANQYQSILFVNVGGASSQTDCYRDADCRNKRFDNNCKRAIFRSVSSQLFWSLTLPVCW